MINAGTILVVEDTLASLKLITDILSAEGYKVRPANGGELALASVEAMPPELILLDIRMPGMDGFEVLRRLKAQKETCDIPVIILSASVEGQQRVECLNLGAVDFISKPYQPDELLARVRTHMELFRLRVRFEQQADDLRLANEQCQIDIARRTEAEATLVAESQFNSLIIENAGQGICVCYKIEEFPHVRFTVWNECMTLITGYSMVEINRLGWYQTMYPDPEVQERAIIRMRNMRVGDNIEAEEWEITRADGKKRTLLITTRLHNGRNGEPIVLGVMNDITARKQAEEAKVRAAEEWQATFDATNDAIWILDKDQRVLQSNRTAERFFHRPFGEMIGKHCWEIVHGTEQPIPECPILRVQESLHRESMELLVGESWYEVNVDPILDAAGQYYGAVHIVSDINEKKKAEAEIRQSEKRFRIIFERSTIGKSLTLPDGTIHQINKAFADMLGYTSEQIEQVSFAQITHPDDVAESRECIRILLANEQTGYRMEKRYIHNDGNIIWADVSTTLLRDEHGIPLYFITSIVDITLRKQAEEALRESEANYRQLFDNSPAGIYQIDFRTGKLVKANDVMCKYLGYRQKEITSVSPHDFLTNESKQLFSERINKMMRGEEVTENPEFEIVDKEGTRRWVQLNVKYIYDSEGLAGADVVAHEVTDRKRAEDALRKSEEEFRSLAESMPQIVWATRKDGWNIYFNQQWVDYTGLTLEESCGHGWNTPFHPDDRQRAWEAWENATKNNGSYSLECRLRRADGVYRWYLVRGVPLIDETGEILKWFGTCTDIDNIKNSEKQLQETLESLRKAVGTTIQVMVSAVESRDPYTSGHQLRSADLARAIATEMALTLEKIEGLHMAASIHDIGKLSIPAEILSKPTKLSELEFSLIKEHARKGFEMLKDVKSPWPLAEIVHQHHERMDGSGYPRNLKGEEICIEARILCVADVVEAMASHRPYRAGLGIDAALAEIEKNRGIFYDKSVADACLRLFREKGFQLAEA